MKHVCKLFKLRHKKKKWKKSDYLYVIEPQEYYNVSKLTPKDFMFEENNFIWEEGDYMCGYFHSGKSGIAQSGDGGDSMWQ